ncbi:MAG: flagellar filament capping protein FliD [Sulfurimonas sp.]|nr:flagellar filament capping protein FliD [Sulfurimonas sp.]
MAGTINSLGIGSGILTADLIDKLRTADTDTIIKPLENKITLANQKEDAFNLLSSLMTTFKASAAALDSENLYLGRSVSGSTDAVSITTEGGSDLGSFNITDVSKAEKDVWNSNNIGVKSEAVPNLGAGTFSITIGEETFDIDYTASSTLNSIRDSINEKAGEKMTASVLQVGPDNYQLVITADNVNQAITFSDSNTAADPLATSLETALGLNNIQPAKAATFKYNGIEITRSSNEISDLINGVKITLNKNQTVDESASISITQNTTAINSEMSIFVQNYNNLISNLQDMTNSDRESGAVGIFNGDSFVKSIQRELTTMMTQMNNKTGASLIDYGIDIDSSGVMTLDTSILNTKLQADPKALELFFRGDSTNDGFFTKLNATMTDYTGYNKLLSNFSNQLSSAKDLLTTQYDKQTASLDSRYEILSKKFQAYDAIISRINSQFSSLQMMIDAEANSNNN